MTKKNPSEWILPFKFRDKKTMLLYNDPQELKEFKKSMKQRPEQIYITYLFYNHNLSKYNITTRIYLNQDNFTLSKLLKELNNFFIKFLNRSYHRLYQLEGKKLEALKIIGFSLKNNE